MAAVRPLGDNMIHRYIIDTNMLIQYPEVLTRVSDEIKLVLPQTVLDEISRGSSTGRWLELKALVQGFPSTMSIVPKSGLV